MKIDLGGLGIISSDEKRLLEDGFVESKHFQQRKSYDEYYININEVDVDLNIKDLTILAEQFEVSVGIDRVTLET